jgi:hypothetical protein
MYKAEIKTAHSTIYIEEDVDFSTLIHWAESIALSEEKDNRKVQSIDIFEEDRHVASLRVFR